MNSKIARFSDMIESRLYDYFEPCRDEYRLLFDAMSYSVKSGGKRVRPLLTLLFCDACGGEPERALPLAVAVEYIHTYSLIHDDLPCMDDSDLRRGRPSNHKVFGEAYALLAGDGLLTAAFEVIAAGADEGAYGYDVASRATHALARLAGPRGMVGGQVIDLLSENKSIDIDTLTLMDERKTADLIEAACTLGCLCAGASDEQLNAAAAYARALGVAFQIKDDLLDVSGSAAVLGKPVGADAAHEKSTYTALLGVEKCNALVTELTENALAALDAFAQSDALREFTTSLANREN